MSTPEHEHAVHQQQEDAAADATAAEEVTVAAPYAPHAGPRPSSPANKIPPFEIERDAQTDAKRRRTDTPPTPPPRTVCVLDVETTGLPVRTGLPFDAYPPHTDLAKYDTCRVVRVSWVILDADDLHEIRAHDFVVKPVDFEIPRFSERFHGITQARALATGTSFASIAEQMTESVRDCDVLVAHNLPFDKNIMLSELYRDQLRHVDAPSVALGELTDRLRHMEEWCTMKHGRRHFGGGKSPRLDELFYHLVDANPLTDASVTNVAKCVRVYRKLDKRSA